MNTREEEIIQNEKIELNNLIKEIEKCITFVENGSTDNSNEFYRDINTLLSLYNSLDQELIIKNRNRFLKRLRKDIKDIKGYLNNTKDLKYNDIPSWKAYFRETIQELSSEFKTDYDMQELKHSIENKNEIIENLHGNKFNNLLHEYNYINRIVEDINDTIIEFKNVKEINFKDIEEELKEFNNITINYYDGYDKISKNTMNLLKKALLLESKVLFIIEKYKE